MTAALRLEGGIGDHLMGLRLAHFINQRFPDYAIDAYLDCAGQSGQMAVTQMCPLLRSASHIYKIQNGQTLSNWGGLDIIRPEDLSRMMSAEVFVDGCGHDFWIPQAQFLDVSPLDIFRHRPALRVPDKAVEAANLLLSRYENARFVGLNVTAYGQAGLQICQERILSFVNGILEESDAIVLNLFTSAYDHKHWPDDVRPNRKRQATEECLFAMSVSAVSNRIVSCVDLPIQTIAALLARCSYFVGVDNGIKHLAWAQGVPLTLFCPHNRSLPWVFRWGPDVHRLLTMNSTEAAFRRHLTECIAAVGRDCSRGPEETPELITARQAPL